MEIIDYKLKYLKYKSKYLQLKMYGGDDELRNNKNILVMGAGPIGLITTLGLLTRYPYKTAKKKTDENTNNYLDANNIFLVGKDVPWRPQVFFFQNSFRDYDSIDFLRDIDLETYKVLEKIGCYIGSAASSKLPYCFTQSREAGKSKSTLISESSETVRAPKNIPMTDDEKMYLMTHLSFHVSDLETVLLDRINIINNENINYYCEQTFDEFTEKYNVFIEIINSDENRLMKALLMKDYMIEKKLINKDNFRPLVIIIHPYNKYKNANQNRLYYFIKKNDIDNYIPIPELSQELLNKVGNYFTNEWNIIKDEDYNLKLQIGKTDGKMWHNEYIILSNDTYEIIFESEGGAKQYGSKEDYWYIKNRDTMTLTNKYKINMNLFLLKLLNINSIIELSNDTLKDYYIITDVKLNLNNSLNEEEKKFISANIQMRKLRPMDAEKNIDNCILEDKEIMLDEIIKIDKQQIINYMDTEESKKFYDGEIIEEIKRHSQKILNETYNTEFMISIFNLNTIDYNDKCDDTNYDGMQKFNRIFYKIFLKYLEKTSLIIKIDGITYTEIYKINSLLIEEVKKTLDNATNAIVYASVWMYPTQNELTNGPNYMFIDKWRSTGNLPLSSTNYKDKNKVRDTLKCVDYKSLPNQVYVNNDQVQRYISSWSEKKIQYLGTQYLNKEFGSEILYNRNYMPAPSSYNARSYQHAFRVFGVNLLNTATAEEITTEELKPFFKYTSVKKYYYCGMQISTEINRLLREYRENEKVANFIYKQLYILGFLFTRSLEKIQYNIKEGSNIIAKNENLKTFFKNFNNVDKPYETFYNYITSFWVDSYEKSKPDTIDYNTPIHNKLKTCFPIALRYKEKTIENDNGYLVFNMGDSNTTVNFFSGTGLNTGISNIKNIFEKYLINNSEEKTQSLNLYLEKKNRRTIYNSLFSTQNASMMLNIRNFKINPDGTRNRYLDTTYKYIGPFVSNLNEKMSYDEAKKYIDDNIKYYRKNFMAELEFNGEILTYLLNFESFFDYFFNKDTLGSMLEVTQINEIKKLLYLNIFECYSKIQIETTAQTPISPNLDVPYININYEKATYLNHIIYNYVDHCNMMRSELNKNNYCDILQTDDDDYDPTRTSQMLPSFKFNTY